MKFMNLLKKELRELINAQMIFGLVITMVLLLSIGKMMSKINDEASSETGKINISDMDDTEMTRNIISSLEEMGFEINRVTEYNPDRAALLKSIDCDSLIIIPNGFTEKANASDSPDMEQNGNSGCEIEFISAIKSSSAIAMLSDKTSDAIEIVKDIMKSEIMTKNGLSGEDIARIEAPFTLNEVTVVKDKSANANSQVLISLMQSQSMFIPIVVFILVMFTSQMIISAISTEKIDKTLETLLSAPVTRISVLSAKMLAAAIVAIINAVVYMIGFYGYMGSMLSESINAEVVGKALSINDIMKELGLKISFSGYFLVGFQMFMTIMICLAASLILGALVNDAKSAQTMIMPIMVLAMIPYMVSMLYDVNMLSPVLKTLIYAIPFTHTFNAMNNIMFGNMDIYWFGLVYQIILFAICMFFAVKLFTSDKIFTISLNLVLSDKQNTKYEKIKKNR